VRRLLKDARAGRFDALCVYKLDRLTRSLADLLNIVNLLGGDIALVSLTEDFNTDSAMGRAMLKIMGTFAELESEQKPRGCGWRCST